MARKVERYLTMEDFANLVVEISTYRKQKPSLVLI